jgi:hypothetical protein
VAEEAEGGREMSDESSLTTGDKSFTVSVTDIDGNVRWSSISRYSEAFLETSTKTDPMLALEAIDQLRKKICQMYGLEKVKPSELNAEEKKTLAGLERVEHDFENSTNLMSASHQGDRLEVTFKNGTAYRYLEVPRAVYDELVKAESAGKFLNQMIKGKFKYEKVEDDEQTA